MQLSIILPTKNNKRTITQCVESLIDQTLEKHIYEIIHIDNFSDDGTYEIVGSLLENSGISYIQQQVGPERHAQRPAGVAASMGRYIYFIDSDMYAAPGLCKEIVENMQHIDALIIPEKNVDYPDYWTQVKAHEREFYQGDDQTEAARVFTRTSYEAVGGFNPKLIAAEDRDLTAKIRKAGYAVGRTISKVLHDEGIIHLRQLLKKKTYYASKMQDNILETQEKPCFQFLNLISKCYFLRPVFYQKWHLHKEFPFLSIGLFFLLVMETGAVLHGFGSRLLSKK